MSEVIKTRGQDAATDALNSEFSSPYDIMKALVPCFSHSPKMPLHLIISEKFNGKQEFERVKARIVIGGNLQTGIEDIETHSHCIRNETVCSPSPHMNSITFDQWTSRPPTYTLL
jgi:hypothetical protein